MHTVFNPNLKKYTRHFPKWYWQTITWDTDGKRKVWCYSPFCHESKIIGEIKIQKEVKNDPV